MLRRLGDLTLGRTQEKGIREALWLHLLESRKGFRQVLGAHIVCIY